MDWGVLSSDAAISVYPMHPALRWHPEPAPFSSLRLFKNYRYTLGFIFFPFSVSMTNCR
ncbi:hypothetical protein KP509_18G001800 [Ceratopteris richardii]|uniref:Uncharacterized protein n=1 Tax=Ceratopteris richardii TaxID=49495 RepID=A0A8T2SLY7_CERRI|nr:hypothetical protein KP509_18G001800 [Ceratopteris richardii]